MRNELKQKQKPKQKQRCHCSIFEVIQHGRLICYYFYLLLMFLFPPHVAAQSSSQPPPSMIYGFSNSFSPSLIIVLVVILIAFLSLLMISVCVHQCSRTSIDGSIGVNGMEGHMSRKERCGLDPAVIESFPTFSYSHFIGHKLGNEALECAVCLNEFDEEDTIRLLPKCNHDFHVECIDAWLFKRKTCPVCRANLVAVPVGKPATMVPVQDLEEGDSNGEILTLEPVYAVNQQFSITVISDEP